jgi:hypothetical protein
VCLCVISCPRRCFSGLPARVVRTHLCIGKDPSTIQVPFRKPYIERRGCWWCEFCSPTEFLCMLVLLLMRMSRAVTVTIKCARALAYCTRGFPRCPCPRPAAHSRQYRQHHCLTHRHGQPASCPPARPKNPHHTTPATQAAHAHVQASTRPDQCTHVYAQSTGLCRATVV